MKNGNTKANKQL